MNLTQEQLIQNAEAFNSFVMGGKIQWKHSVTMNWIDYSSDQVPRDLHRLEYRPKPEPKTRPWSNPEDVPGPVCWIRTTSTDTPCWLITATTWREACLGAEWQPWSWFVKNCEYSTDRKTWKPCEVQE